MTLVSRLKTTIETLLQHPMRKLGMCLSGKFRALEALQPFFDGASDRLGTDH